MFNHINGPIEPKYAVMENAIERTYATLVRYVVHDARSKSQRRKLPNAFPDYPTQQGFTFDLKDVTVNNGLHYHGILLIRTDTKMQTDLKAFFKENKKHFVKVGGPIRQTKGAHVSLLGWIIAAYSDYSSCVLCQREHNFRMLFSSSEEPNTASMAACLALIFESIQKSIDPGLPGDT
jgi:hypothetical protein